MFSRRGANYDDDFPEISPLRRVLTDPVVTTGRKLGFEVKMGTEVPKDCESLFRSWEDFCDQQDLWQVKKPTNARDWIRKKACDVISESKSCDKFFSGSEKEKLAVLQSLRSTGAFELKHTDVILKALAYSFGLDVVIINEEPGPKLRYVSHLALGGKILVNERVVVLGYDGRNFQSYIPRMTKDERTLREMFNKWQFGTKWQLGQNGQNPMKRKRPFVPQKFTFKVRRIDSAPCPSTPTSPSRPPTSSPSPPSPPPSTSMQNLEDKPKVTKKRRSCGEKVEKLKVNSRSYDDFQRELLKSLPMQVCSYVGNLKKKREIKRLDAVNFAVRDCNEKGELMVKSAKNYVVVRKLVGLSRSGETDSLVVCMKCNVDSQSIVAAVQPTTIIKEDVKKKSANSCCHAQAMSLIDPKEYPVKSGKVLKTKIVLISSKPHIAASYDGKSFGIIKFNQALGAKLGKCTTCKGKNSRCAHAQQWLSHFKRKFNIGTPTTISGNCVDKDLKESEHSDYQEIKEKVEFPWRKETADMFSKLEREGHKYVDLKELIPKYDPEMVCVHGCLFDSRSPR